MAAPDSLALQDIHRVAVLGAGMMGPGIALQFARAGHDVTLWGLDPADVGRGQEAFERNLADLRARTILSARDARSARKRLRVETDLARAVADADFVSEAVPEVLELKQEIFERLDRETRPQALLTSSTSGLMPSQLCARMTHRRRMLVAHFWNPAYLCPLVEVCGNGETSAEATATAMALLRHIGNRPVLVRVEIPGFIGNRIMHAMNREAIGLIQKSVCSAEEIDEAVLASFGPRFANLGPMEYLDFCGLDHIARIQGYLYQDLECGGGPMPLIARCVDEGRLGAKSGRGLCDWAHKEVADVRARRDQEFLRRRAAAVRPQRRSRPSAPARATARIDEE
jgi:3-hydroxybutyryl-CoA dehydrogenase